MNTVSNEHANCEILRTVYSDLGRLGEFATDDVVLHRADRPKDGRLEPDRAWIVVGKHAVVEHERALIEATNETLVMDVAHIAANQYFGAVLGTLRASHPHRIAMPFCGLWRFVNGSIAEHWENAYAPEALATMFAAGSGDEESTATQPLYRTEDR